MKVWLITLMFLILSGLSSGFIIGSRYEAQKNECTETLEVHSSQVLDDLEYEQEAETSPEMFGDYKACIDYLRNKYTGHTFMVVNANQAEGSDMVYTVIADDDIETKFSVYISYRDGMQTMNDDYRQRA